MTSLQDTSQPFGMSYSVVVQRYAKTAGDLLLVRPRLIGIRGSGLLETKEPRQTTPVVFEGPRKDTDHFEIALPAGYTVDDLPPARGCGLRLRKLSQQNGISGNALRYTRTFEIKELTVPMDKMDDLKKFYRIIAGDETQYGSAQALRAIRATLVPRKPSGLVEMFAAPAAQRPCGAGISNQKTEEAQR